MILEWRSMFLHSHNFMRPFFEQVAVPPGSVARDYFLAAGVVPGMRVPSVFQAH